MLLRAGEAAESAEFLVVGLQLKTHCSELLGAWELALLAQKAVSQTRPL